MLVDLSKQLHGVNWQPEFELQPPTEEMKAAGKTEPVNHPVSAKNAIAYAINMSGRPGQSQPDDVVERYDILDKMMQDSDTVELAAEEIDKIIAVVVAFHPIYVAGQIIKILKNAVTIN